MLHEILRTETRQEHTLIESSIDLLKFTANRQDYISLLKAFFGFYQPVEKIFTELENDFTSIGIHINYRLKLPLLIKDLTTLGVCQNEMNSIPLNPGPQKISDLYQAMGVLYVLEGSTMGGKIIHRKVREANILTSDDLCFHNPYGPANMSQWNDFKAKLDLLPENKHPLILKSAKETFSGLNHWLHTCLI